MTPAPPTISDLQSQGATLEAQAAAKHAGGWQAYASQLPKDITDSGYSAIREKYFYENMAPEVLQQGASLSLAKDHFMAATERPKAAYPRLDVVAQEAGKSLEEPISAMSPVGMSRRVQGDINERAAGAAEELKKQGGWPAPYQMLGQAIGMAPYFAEGMMGPEAGLEEAATKGLTKTAFTDAGKEVVTKEAREAIETYQKNLISRATRTSAVSLIQGAYDSVTAPEGQRGQAFVHGAVTGGLLAGGIEGVGGLWNFLKASHGLGTDEAKAIEAVAKGGASPKDEALATGAILNTSDVDKSIQGFVGEQKAAAQKQGQPGTIQLDPKVGKVFTPSGRIRILMTGADGKTYNLGGAVGLKVDEIEKINSRVVEHLNAGGSIQGLYGDPAVVNQTLNKLAEMNPEAFSLSNPVRMVGEGVKVAPVNVPAAMEARASIRPDSIHDLINARDSLYHATSPEGISGILKAGFIAPGENLHDDLPDFINLDSGVSTSRVPRIASKADKSITLVLDPDKMPKTRPFVEEGGWGKTIESFGLDHKGDFYGKIAQKQFDQFGSLEALKVGLPKVQSKHFEFENRTYNESVPLTAVRGAIIDSSAISDQALKDILGQLKSANISYKVMRDGREMHSYRGGLSKLAPEQRWAVSPADIPTYDKFTQLPSGEILNKETGQVSANWEEAQTADVSEPTSDHTVYGIERGQANIPLSLRGRKNAAELGKRIAAKGGLDSLHMADLDRYRQTADGIMSGDKAVAPHMPNPSLRSWNHGFEGLEQTPHTVGEINKLVDNPDGHAYSQNGPGESFRDFDQRISSAIREPVEQLERNPDKKIGVVTSSRDIGLIRAKLNARRLPTEEGVDPQYFKGAQENPGSVYRLAKGEDGKWNIRGVNMDADAPLKGGIYLIRHEETPWNKSARELQFKDTPLSRRFVGSSEMTPDGVQGVSAEFPGSKKPDIFYRDSMDKGAVFHENLHGHFGALSMHENVMDALDDPMTEQIYSAGFSPASRDIYGDDPYFYREEVYVHGADAIRTNNEQKIKLFADADDGKEHWLDWMAQKTDDLLALASTRSDSLHKRTLERRLTSVLTRATNSLDDLQRTYSQSGTDINFAHDHYGLTEGQRTTLYPTREEALASLESKGEPLNAPELVPLDYLPEGVPRYSRKITPPTAGGHPNLTDPPNPTLGSSDGGPTQAKGGLQLASRFFRPFNDWIATVAQKNNWPELYSAFAPLDRAQVEFNNTVRPYFQTLKETLGALPESRQKDLMKYFTNPSDFVRGELKVTPGEKAMLDRVQTEVLDPLSGRWGLDLKKDYLEGTLAQVKAAGDDWKGVVKDNKDFMSTRLRRGSLDPEEDNLAKLTAKYLEFGAWNEHIKPAVDAAQKVVDEKLEDGDKRAGNLAPLLQRHLDYLKGQPDYTQEIIKGAMQGAVDLINQGFEKLGMEKRIHEIQEDPLGKYTLFMYAGALAMKPSTIIRDGLQLMLTTFPVAGKWTFKGLEKAFGAFDKAKREELWDIPQRYGALIEKSDLRSLYDGSVEEPITSGTGPGLGSKLAKGAESAANFGMKSIQLTHNGNRLAAFWGHALQMQDALDTFRTTGDQSRFIRESGLWFMSPSQRETFLHEVPTLQKGVPTDDFSYRAAKELVELTQWNFKRGANPGLYEYQLGRLFGQYGTWPLNYIEYARRLATSGDGRAQGAALTRLVLAHGAVLAAGQGMGVDTSNWVFAGPMSYEGGPLFNAVTHLTQVPQLASEGQEGEEARRNILGVVPGLDRIVEAKELFTDIAGGEEHSWLKILGFHAMKEADYSHGLHKYLPGAEE